MSGVRITVLVDNVVRAPGLLGEHGLSYLIETGERRILFDTGQGMVLRHNAVELNLPLGDLDAVVLSHGHYDHTGGLGYVLGEARRPSIYLHPAALNRKFSRRGGSPARYIGIPESAEQALRGRSGDVVWTRRATEVAPGVFATGEIPRRTGFEDTGGGFYLDTAGEQVDPLEDDQALSIDTPRGLVLLLGCCHAGVVNTMEHVAGLRGRDRIYAVLGGMHLLRASRERLDATAAALRRYEVEFLAPGHCTGLAATAFLRERFPSQFHECVVGARFEFTF